MQEVSFMSQTTKELQETLAKLPMQERAELANFLIHSLDIEWDAETQAAWDAELARRRDEIISGKAQGEDSREVFAKLREKHS
jgi:putative addiction module component (TIGR02574 family)